MGFCKCKTTWVCRSGTGYGINAIYSVQGSYNWFRKGGME
jgi:hypothetical protein